MINNKVPVICAFRLMQEVYSPLKKFRNEMVKNGLDDYVALVNKFILVGHDKALNNDIIYFKDVDMSFTINQVSKSIVILYDKYNPNFSDNRFMLALASIFSSLWKDFLLQ